MVSAGNLGGATQAPVASTHSGPFNATTDAGGTDQAYGSVQSARVYAIVAGMFGLIGLALILMLFMDKGDADEDAGAGKGTATVAEASSTTSSRSTPKDTGGPPAPPVRTASRARSSAPAPAAGAGSAPRSGGATRSKGPSVGGGNIIVRLPDSTQASGVELVCGGGAYRLRKSFSGGVASFSGVPGGVCTFYFKGGLPSQFTPVTAGRSYSCSVIGSTAVCK